MEIIFFFLGLISLVALCWRFTKPAFYVLVFLAPFLGLTLDFSHYSFAQKIPGLSGFEAPLADFLAIIIFLSLLLKTWQISKKGWYVRLWLISLKETGWEFFLPFLVVGLASLINVEPEQLGGSFKYFFRPIIFFYLMWIVLPHFLITTKEILYRTLWITVIAGIAATWWGILSAFLKSGSGLWKRITPGEIFGLTPLTYNHNILAEVLVMSAPLAFYFFLKNQKSNGRWPEKAFFLSFALITVVGLLTFSRAAWIALLAELFIYLLLQNQKTLPRQSTAEPQKKLWKKAGLLFVLLSPIIIYMAAFSFSSIVRSSTTTRLDMTGIAWVYFSAHPVIGNGVGTFTKLIGDTRLFTVEYGDPLDSHGVIQKLLAETGLAGLIAFFIFIGWIIKELYQSARYETMERSLKILLFTSFLGSLIFQLFNTSYYNQHLWLIVGIALAAKKIYQRELI